MLASTTDLGQASSRASCAARAEVSGLLAIVHGGCLIAKLVTWIGQRSIRLLSGFICDLERLHVMIAFRAVVNRALRGADAAVVETDLDVAELPR